ncbi:hypothetical protein G8S49_03085 [Clostridium botulinum C]|uniref:Uncharacterized protein n=4 Tax=Clostridium TaxID=1485 RepID=A0A9Q4XWG7_CLOBO|nr:MULTISPECIES: hypothetical protein [Clostridium]AYF54631.1 hypothetical protein DFH04_07915 [Clostridium novyi]EES90957.1 conserved hypothetical protein [Clostridium botulinum D str. 1873]MCD3194525.1 hypothetical protein [Clostridium botulinum C]MCD3199679.1 hypothetical protein [Clostridium botulinum C]MCD3205154.1 hypothetical protein [Clostridium botulinum C]
MKTTKNYGYTLKKLLSFTDTKFMVLSKAVGYDISYISKWCNNIKIPTLKNINSINEKASIIFAGEIMKQDKVKDFYKIFEIQEPVNLNDLIISDILQEEIYDLLDSAYRKSEDDLCDKTEKKQEESQIIVGKNQVTNFIKELICSTIENSTSDIELLSTMDICKSTSKINLDIMEEFKFDGIRVNAKIGFNMDEFEKDPNFYLWRIYVILNKRWNVEFDFFDNKNMDKLNIIAIRDKFVITCSMDSDGLIEVATVITDKEMVNSIYDKTISKFRMGDILIRSAETSGMELGGYRTDFYSNNEFQFLSTNGFEFLLPSDVISDIIDTAYDQGFGDDTSFLIKKLQITWEERFEKSKINFIILKSTLMKYIEDGEIFYTYIRYKLSTQQRKEHARSIVESMKKNNNIKIVVLDDERFNYNLNFFKISAYVNSKKVFFKKNLKCTPGCTPLFYTIANEKLVKYINQYFSYIKNKEFCVEYNAEDVEEFLDKYGTMFFRMIEAKNCSKKSDLD